MNPATTTTANLTQQLMTLYDRHMLTRLMKELQFADIADKKPLPANSGKQITFNRYANLAAITTALTDGAVPTAQTLSSANVSSTVSGYGGYVSISDFIDMTAVSDVVKNALDVLSYQAALSIDTIIRNVVDTNGAANYANGRANLNALTTTDVLNASEVRKMVRILKNAAVKPHSGSDYVCVIHTESLYDLQSDTNTGGWLVSNQYASPDKIFNNEIGKMYGVRFLESQNATSQANGTSVNCYSNYFFGREGLGMVDLANGNLKTIVHPAGSAGGADPLNQINTVGWKVYFSAVVLDATRCQVDIAGSAF